MSENYEQQEQEQEQASVWYIKEGVLGIGQKPEYFIDTTYKTVEAQLKAHRQDALPHITKLEQKLKGHLGAPEKYNRVDELDGSEVLVEWGKKHGITQSCMDIKSDALMNAPRIGSR